MTPPMKAYTSGSSSHSRTLRCTSPLDGSKCKMMARSSSARTLGFRLFHSLAIRMTLLEVTKDEGRCPSPIVRFESQ
jgi:hypothetical protein